MPINEIEKKFQLHFLVWKNEYGKLKEILDKDKTGIESSDTRGRTPLMLSIILGHVESTRVLLAHNANVFCVNYSHWTATQEAISTGNQEMVKLLIVHRDQQRVHEQATIMAKVLSKLKETSDFYVELKWEFFSWLPMVTRMCPSDICRIWKSGGNVRVDTTLVDFSGKSDWVRGNLSYIFQLNDDGAIISEINHQDCRIYQHHTMLPIKSDSTAHDLNSNCLPVPPSDVVISHKLSEPIFATYVETEKIEFEKSKSGIWGWRSDKKEIINGHDCHIFSASNVQIVTLKRIEHLPDSDKDNTHEHKPTINEHEPIKANIPESIFNPNQVTPEEYFTSKVALPDRHIGRPKSMTTKVKTLKAHLSVCDNYPLSMQNQILPIIELMAKFNPHFKKLRDFLTMPLPVGFPMKIEIPLYHILTARITVDNLFAANKPVECVNVQQKTHDAGVSNRTDKPSVDCVIDKFIFQIPSHYHIVEENSPGHGGGVDEEDQLVQMAVQASLTEYGGSRQLSKRTYNLRDRSVQNTSGDFGDLDDADLQRAIAASLTVNCPQHENEPMKNKTDEELTRALELSKVEK